MKIGRFIVATIALWVGINGTLSSQELEQFGSRKCTIAGSETHAFVSSNDKFANCSKYCTIDKSQIQEFRDYPGEVFICESRASNESSVQQSATNNGLADSNGGVLAGIALILGLAAISSGGSTNGTN